MHAVLYWVSLGPPCLVPGYSASAVADTPLMSCMHAWMLHIIILQANVLYIRIVEKEIYILCMHEVASLQYSMYLRQATVHFLRSTIV